MPRAAVALKAAEAALQLGRGLLLTGVLHAG